MTLELCLACIPSAFSLLLGVFFDCCTVVHGPSLPKAIGAGQFISDFLSGRRQNSSVKATEGR